jgi:hypothetical protein
MTLLNTADALYVGEDAADVAYLGTDEVWSSVPAPFAPDDIAGLQVWLDASQIVGLSDGDPVATWEDASSANHDFTQATSGFRPTYQTGELNGLPVVRFDGSDDWMGGGNLSASFPSAATVFAVFTPNTDAEYTIYMHDSSNGFWRETSTGNGYFHTFLAARINGYPTTMPNSGDHMVSLISSASTYNVWLDGVDKGAQTANYAAGTFHVVGTDGGSGPLNGDVAEIIVYDSALSDPDRTTVEAYLTTKWGL